MAISDNAGEELSAIAFKTIVVFNFLDYQYVLMIHIDALGGIRTRHSMEMSPPQTSPFF
jgi:hypothetical protein